MVPSSPGCLRILQSLVSALKERLEAMCNVPASRQRLIMRGRVLRDEQRLDELSEWPLTPCPCIVDGESFGKALVL